MDKSKSPPKKRYIQKGLYRFIVDPDSSGFTTHNDQQLGLNEKLKLSKDQVKLMDTHMYPEVIKRKKADIIKERNTDLERMVGAKIFLSDSPRDEKGVKLEARNGLTPSMLQKVMKQRESQQNTIKDALSTMTMLSGTTAKPNYSLYKRNPNLNVSSGGLLMMREKSTMEVIQ